VLHHRNTTDKLLIVETYLGCKNQSKEEQYLQKIEKHIEVSSSPYVYGLLIKWATVKNNISLQWISKDTLIRKQKTNEKNIYYKGNYVIDSYKSFKIPVVKTEPYIVGLLDILGAQTALENLKKEKLFVNILNRNYHLLDFLKVSNGTMNFLSPDEVIIRIYSDNILFLQRSHHPPMPLWDFNLIRAYMAKYQMLLLSSGLASRGYITQGKLFINNTFVIGNALVKVHKAEENIVKYPRVVIDPLLMKLLPDQVHRYPYPPDPLLRKDRIDGYYFLDYYKTLLIAGGKVWHRELYMATMTIVTEFKNSTEQTFPKWYWLAKYHNRFCKTNSCVEFIIPENIIKTKQKEISRHPKNQINSKV